MPKRNLLGVEIDTLTSAEALERIISLAANPKSKAVYVVKPYVELMERAAKDQEFTTLLNQAELCLPDGIALIWGAHYLYGGPRTLTRLLTTLFAIVLRPQSLRRPLPEAFRGIDFTLKLLNEAARSKLSVFLVGSPKKSSIAGTARFIKQTFPGVEISGHFTGHLNPGLKVELEQKLRTLRPDLVLIGIGFPAQERLAAELAMKLNHGVFIGEGGSFDYWQLGGRLPRAPHFIRQIGLEWLWRLGLEPSRVGRQLTIFAYIKRIYDYGRQN